MLRSGGYFVDQFFGGEIKEHDTFTCKHCNGIVKVPPGMVSVTVGEFCRKCMGHICDRCAARMNATLQCVPFERWLARKEGRDAERKYALDVEKEQEFLDKNKRIIIG